MNEACIIELDPDAIAHNVGIVRSIVGPRCEICAIVKADAYGLGMERVGPRLVQAGVDMLAVFSLAEAAELAPLSGATPIQVLGPVREPPSLDRLYRPLMTGRVRLTVHDLEHARVLEAMGGQLGLRLAVTLEVDSGMNRGGCPVEEAAAVIDLIAASQRLRLTGLMTHFAAADTNAAYTLDQLERFDAFVDAHRARLGPDCRIHAANTYATLRDDRYHRSLVRIGLGWSGYGLQLMTGPERIEAGWSLRPCFRWLSRIVQVKRVPAGETVGYGRRWTAARDSVIGVVPVGYAAGYPRALSGHDGDREHAEVGVFLEDGERFFAPVVGSVNMDQITIDLTDAIDVLGPGAARVDAGVELIGDDPDAPNAVPRIAMLAGTIPHEIMCRLDPRIPRVFRRERAVPEVVTTGTVLQAG